MKIWNANSSEKIRIDYKTVFNEIYDWKYELIGTGDLRYKE